VWREELLLDRRVEINFRKRLLKDMEFMKERRRTGRRD
jgi:hypothetical protein